MDYLKGKHIFGPVKVGPKGQIVIPSEARKVFGIASGDSLMVLGDEESGLALLTNRELIKFFSGLSELARPGMTDAETIERMKNEQNPTENEEQR